MTKKNIPSRLTDEEMHKLAVKYIQDYVNACHCKSEDDVLLALSCLVNVGGRAGNAVSSGSVARHTIQ